MKNYCLLLCLLFLLIAPSSVWAQFHESTSTGKTQIRRMNNPFNGTGQQSRAPGAGNRVIEGTSAFIMPTEVNRAEAGNHVRIKFKKKMPKATDVWGRAENHPDGTYTETISDIKDKQSDNLIIQHTRKKSMIGESPIILIRKITLNHLGQPDEVMIYDGSNNYKYHGQFVYDSMGRLIEEQLRSANGVPLRRTVQKYSPTGDYLPLETYDYVKNIPKDLQLVITSTDPLEQQKLEELNAMYGQAKRQGLFAGRKKKKAAQKALELQEQMSGATASPAQPQAATQPKEVGGKKFQLFKRRKRN